MNWKRFFPVILFLFIICSSISAENDSNTYLPFNPADETIANDVTDYLFRDTGSHITLQYTFLALGKNKRKCKVAQEIYNITGYQELLELDFPAGKISVYTYLHEFLGIDISPSDHVVITEEHYSDCEMDDNGVITLTNKDNTTSYYLLQFEINGAHVPFINNPEIKVISLIFLKKGIPLLGIINSKFFPMVNFNGQWIRTNGIDQIEIKNESISRAEQLIKIRPWTKLTHYIIAQDSTEQNEQFSLNISDLYEGLRILVKKEGFYYPASISGIDNDNISILFLDSSYNNICDDDSPFISIEDIKPFFWQEGTNIQVRLEQNEEWIHCTIWDLNTEDETVNIFMEDSDIPIWVSLSDCRQQMGFFDNPEIDNSSLPIDSENNSYDTSSAEMDEAWEKFMDYLEEKGIDPADLSDEEFLELMNEMYKGL